MKHFQLTRKVNALLRVMSPKDNIKVAFQVSGTAAVDHDRSVIYLPRVDLTQEDNVELVEGLIDHEIGHVDETDAKASAESSRRHSVVNSLRQGIEDVRMEHLRMRKWPGTRQNLERTVRQAIKRGWFTAPDPDNPLGLVSAILLYNGRAHFNDQQELVRWADDALVLGDQHLPPAVMKVLRDCITNYAGLRSNWDSLEMAQRVFEVLQQEAEMPPEQPPSQGGGDGSDSDSDPEGDEGEQGGDAGSDSDPDGDEDEQGGDAGSDSDPDGDEDEQGGDAGSDSDPDGDEDEQGGDAGSDSDPDGDEDEQGGDAGSDSDTDGDEDEQGDDAERGKSELDSQRGAAKTAVDGSPDDALPDLHDAIRAELEEKARTEPKSELPEPILPTASSLLCGGTECTPDAGLVSHAKQVFVQAMVSVTREPVRHDSRGTRVDPRRLAKVPSGELCVFRRPTRRRKPTGAVGLVIDASGSVGDDMPMVNTIAFSMSKALDQIKGMRSAVAYFRNTVVNNGRGYEFYPEENLYLAKGFGQRSSEGRFRVTSGGGTPTGEAMMSMAVMLAGQPVDKRVMIVITDGQAESERRVASVLEMCPALGISCFCLGFSDACQGGFSDQDYIHVGNDVKAIGPALRTAVRQRLFY